MSAVQLTVLAFAEYLCAYPHHVGAFFKGDLIGIGHSHGEVSHVHIGQIDFFQFLKNLLRLHEVRPGFLWIARERPHGHEAHDFYVL